MSDWKSRLPSISEVGSMTKKLVTDIKNSVTEIIKDYQDKHPDSHEQAPVNPDSATPVNPTSPPVVNEEVNKEGLRPKEIMPEKPAEDIEKPVVVKPSEEKPIKTDPEPEKSDSEKP